MNVCRMNFCLLLQASSPQRIALQKPKCHPRLPVLDGEKSLGASSRIHKNKLVTIIAEDLQNQKKHDSPGVAPKTEKRQSKKLGRKGGTSASKTGKRFGHGLSVLTGLRSQLEKGPSVADLEALSSPIVKDNFEREGGAISKDEQRVAMTTELRRGENKQLNALHEVPASSYSRTVSRQNKREGSHNPPNDTGNQIGGAHIHVSNLPDQLTGQDFDALMQDIPGITRWSLKRSGVGEYCGYGLCEAPTEKAAERAIEALSQVRIQGKPVIAVLDKNNVIDGNTYGWGRKEGVSEEIPTTSMPNETRRVYVPRDSDKTSKQGTMRGRETSNNGHSRSIHDELSDLGSSLSNNDVKEVVSTEKPPLLAEDILQAMQKAALHKAKAKQKKRSSAARVKKQSSATLAQEMVDVKPIVVKPEWALQIENLEKCVRQLKSNLV